MKEFLTKLIEFIKSLFKKENNIIMGGSITPKENFKSPIKILIDNGHGINTGGKRSPYSATGVKPEIPFLEYRWNREIAQEVFNDLVLKGYDVEILVPESEDITLGERVRRTNNICNQIGTKNVILVSIHANAVGNGTKWEKAQGWCAYTCVGKTESDILAKYFYDEAERLFSDRKIRYDWSDGDCDYEAGFYVIKNSKCPAILTENFFYDNIDDTLFITSMEGKKKIVELHVNAIINYLEDKKGDK
jgi:N-acetylmuramoyl-L-alanine amidase